MQGGKEMKGKVLTELEGVDRRTDWRTDRRTDRQTDIQADQTDRFQEFHVLYKTKNVFHLNLYYHYL